MTKSLTPRQQRFVQEYMVDLNATQAAIRAGYSERTARQGAAQLLTNINVQGALQAAQARIAEKLDVTVERIVAEYAKMGFADMGDYVNIQPDGNVFFDWSNIPEGGTAAIAEITQDVQVMVSDGEEDGTRIGIKKTKFKLHDKKGALDSLAKHLGMFTERHHHTADDAFAALFGAVDGKARDISDERSVH